MPKTKFMITAGVNSAEAAQGEKEVIIDNSESVAAAGTVTTPAAYAIPESMNDKRIVFLEKRTIASTHAAAVESKTTITLPGYAADASAPVDGWQCQFTFGDTHFAGAAMDAKWVSTNSVTSINLQANTSAISLVADDVLVFATGAYVIVGAPATVATSSTAVTVKEMSNVDYMAGITATTAISLVPKAAAASHHTLEIKCSNNSQTIVGGKEGGGAAVSTHVYSAKTGFKHDNTDKVYRSVGGPGSSIVYVRYDATALLYRVSQLGAITDSANF